MLFVSSKNVLNRIRFQLLFGIIVCALVPAISYHLGNIPDLVSRPASLYSLFACACAFVFALFIFRRVVSLPGIGIFAHVLPAAIASYSFALAIILLGRFNYSGVIIGLSFFFCVAVLFLFSHTLRLAGRRRFYLVPSSATELLREEGGGKYELLEKPEIPHDPYLVLVADLRADLDPAWETLIAEVAVRGYPVYHIKQVLESMTGRVQIDHMSENSFGSLIPNSVYRRFKRLIDVMASLFALPFLIPLFVIVAIAIRIDTRGPIFFTQRRRGYRGSDFNIIKFRTMMPSATAETDRGSAVTKDDDSRITNVGRLLRRTRLDELPQVINILRGDMSWIGPRPEAIPLSLWYQEEIPFYIYRHILRPGITGWAQVNQGHVADIDSVFEKLQYDFYYVKNFSAWLDLLIVWRTLLTVLTGFGAK